MSKRSVHFNSHQMFRCDDAMKKGIRIIKNRVNLSLELREFTKGLLDKNLTAEEKRNIEKD